MFLNIRILRLVRLCLLFSITFLIGCASTTTLYELDSNPQGAAVYRGTIPENMTYYKTTPFRVLSPSSLSWSQDYFQAKKPGFKDTEIYQQPTFMVGTPTKIFFSLESAGQEEFAGYQQSNTIAGYYEYLETYPNSLQSNEAYRAIVLLIAAEEQPEPQYERLVNQYPAAVSVLPDEVRLGYIGPPGMRVNDIQTLLSEGVGSVIIAQKILSAGQPYAEFSFEEIKQLTEMGVTDDVIAAMLKVTSQTKQASSGETTVQQQNVVQQAQGLRQNEVVAAPESQASVGNTVQDAVVDCAAYITKKQACDQLGYLAGMVCMAAIPSGNNC